MSRQSCEFKNCKCTKFVSKKKLCDICNHHRLWHSKKKYNTQFESPRKNARKPQYVSDVIFGQVFIFEPLPLAPSIEVANPYFCSDVPSLPV